MNGKGEGAGPMGAGGARPREATFTFTGTRVRLLCSVHPPPFHRFGASLRTGHLLLRSNFRSRALRSGHGRAMSSRRWGGG